MKNRDTINPMNHEKTTRALHLLLLRWTLLLRRGFDFFSSLFLNRRRNNTKETLAFSFRRFFKHRHQSGGVLLQSRRQDAFTLIELLVVIAIIGILSSVVLASLNESRALARDAERVADMRAIQTALELYYNRHGVYPSTSDSYASTCLGDTSFFSSVDGLGVLKDEEFINEIPDDPQNTNSDWYCYWYEAPSSETNCTNISTQAGYVLRFTVETSEFNFPKFNGINSDYCITHS